MRDVARAAMEHYKLPGEILDISLGGIDTPSIVLGHDVPVQAWQLQDCVFTLRNLSTTSRLACVEEAIERPRDDVHRPAVRKAQLVRSGVDSSLADLC